MEFQGTSSSLEVILSTQQRLLLLSPGRTHLRAKATARKIMAQAYLPLPSPISPSFALLSSSLLTLSAKGSSQVHCVSEASTLINVNLLSLGEDEYLRSGNCGGHLRKEMPPILIFHNW